MAIELTADAKTAGVNLAHFWSLCVGAGRANEGLRAGWRQQLKEAVRACGFRYIRFHGLFHDDMFVYRIVSGKVVYNFQYVDDLFDALLEMGIRPFVELGFCPSSLARDRGTVFWWKANGAPPTDYAQWGELVGRTVRHWVERYGIEEVRTWYFEVWNEPNLSFFFKGTRAEYFELYRVSVQAIKAVDSQLRVGGPATSNFVSDGRFDGETEGAAGERSEGTDMESRPWRPVWINEFLSFCAREKLPVDFVSTHPYPTDWALDEKGRGSTYIRGVDATRKDLSLLNDMIRASAFPKAEIHLTEWNSSPSPRDFTHDYLQAATFIVKVNLESIGLVDSLAYWTFTDVFEESGAGDVPFHGGFGMINYQGIWKPSFHAYRLLNTLGDELLARHTGGGVGGVITRAKATGKIAALVYNYPAEVKQAVPASFDTRDIADQTLTRGHAELVELKLTGLRPGAPVMIETLSRGNGDVMATWRAMGMPAVLSREQTDAVRHAGQATLKEQAQADGTGRLIVKRELDAWGVMSVREV